MSSIPYQNVVGSMMYAMVCTRPDIAYGVSLVSRYMSNPNKSHWLAVKWLARYLKGTQDTCLMYKSLNTEKISICGFCDSDYAADLDKRRSISGYCFTFGGNLISWKSSLQHIVALSTTEAEYIALTEAIKEALWLKGIVSELGFNLETVNVFCDSQSAIHLSKNTMYHERTKHIDVRLHFIRDIISNNEIIVNKIGTVDNPADIFTKSVSVAKFKATCEKLGILKG